MPQNHRSGFLRHNVVAVMAEVAVRVAVTAVVRALTVSKKQ